MVFDEAGTYTIEYTATDECGNTTTEDRTVIVEAPPRTVLYTDGTFIINELSRDIEANVAEHGQPTNVYVPFNPNGATDVDKYIFASASQRPWASERLSILSVEIGSVIHPTSTAYLFSALNSCTSINVDNLDTSLVTDMTNMFSTDVSLTTLDLSSFDTSAVADMSNMFDGCQALTTLNISNFNTSEVTNMSFMFNNCKLLAPLDVSGFDTSKVTDMNSMFKSCQSLTSLDVSAFNTVLVTDMSNMFNGCKLLASLDVSNFKTSVVTTMNSMFRDCQLIKMLDASGFDTSNVTNTTSMFQNCYALTTIYASLYFVTTQITSSNNMFYYDSNIVGGAGTTYNSSYVNKDRAKIDGGVGNEGYFTAKS